MTTTSKTGFTLVGKSTFMPGKTVHESAYSQRKTNFYTELFAAGMLKKLMPASLDKKGYALIVPQTDGIQYYAGVIAEKELDGFEAINVPTQNYKVTKASGGRSRLLFDQLEDVSFAAKAKDTSYNGGILLEVLLNGNPTEAEVELWVPFD